MGNGEWGIRNGAWGKGNETGKLKMGNCKFENGIVNAELTYPNHLPSLTLTLNMKDPAIKRNNVRRAVLKN